MNFDFSEDQREIERTARELLSRQAPLAAAREVAETGSYDDELWQALVALGWPGIAIEESYGGSGLGVVELSILLEQCGYALAASPLLASASAALVIQCAGSSKQRAAWLPLLAGGSATGALGLLHDGEAIVADAQDAAVIVLIERDGHTACMAERDAVELEPLQTIDATRRYARVRGRGSPLENDAGRGFQQALVALSAELVGVCQRALELTTAYVSERKQFGRPVGSFQAVSHRCAEMLLATEGARSATYGAAWAADADFQGLPEAAAVAKAAASSAGLEVTASAIQAHGGIGFSWETDVHWLYKRAQLDATLLGSAGEHHRRLAALVAQRLAAR
jgi:alkylation response protein AidB-like acyl-CoA dehydrogenase